MKKQHKKYSKPKKPFDKTRIEEEARIKEEFGLKNKKEIWKAEAKINSIREKAKKLIKTNPEKQKVLFKQLQRDGFEVNSIADVLALDTSDFLGRRLQTIVFKKKLAPTVKSSRQMISHKKILLDGKAVNKPSYLVRKDEESKISVKKPKIKKESTQENKEETK